MNFQLKFAETAQSCKTPDEQLLEHRSLFCMQLINGDGLALSNTAFPSDLPNFFPSLLVGASRASPSKSGVPTSIYSPGNRRRIALPESCPKYQAARIQPVLRRVSKYVCRPRPALTTEKMRTYRKGLLHPGELSGQPCYNLYSIVYQIKYLVIRSILRLIVIYPQHLAENGALSAS